MFALDFDFKDGASSSEIFLVRRPYARIGVGDDAHILIEHLKNLGFEIEITRELGDGIKISPIGLGAGLVENKDLARAFKNYFSGTGRIETGNFTMNITALDFDLCLKRNEPADKAGIRILRQLAANPVKEFPALVCRDKNHANSVISIGQIDLFNIGRSARCDIRVDNVDISGEHAQISRNGSTYILEDLGSTNGTYINAHRISKEEALRPMDLISLGASLKFILVENQEQYQQALQNKLDLDSEVMLRRYPALISTSDLVRPRRFVMPLNSDTLIGRDPECDIWIGSPSVSRRHCILNFAEKDLIVVTDESRNGTVTSVKTLAQGEILNVQGQPEVIIFNNEVVVAVCFDEQQEKQFLAAKDDLKAYIGKLVSGKNLSVINSNSSDEYNFNSEKNRQHRSMLQIFFLCFGGLGFILFMVLIGSLLWSLWF